MRLSDVKGERTLDVIADIIDPLANIAESKAAKNLFKRQVLPKETDKKAFLMKRIRATIPELLKTNKEDILFILAVIEGVSYEDFIANLDLVKLTKDLIELTNDSAFVELFMHAQTGKQSGSAQESTEDP